MRFIKKTGFLTAGLVVSVLVLVITLFLIPLAHAEIIVQPASNDFSVQTGMSANALEICSCSTFKDELIVTNTGSFAATYAISSNLDYVRFSESTFTLNPKESHTLYYMLADTCTQKEDTLQITLHSNLGITKTITKTFSIGECQNLKASLVALNDTILPCQVAQYKLFVQNIGNYDEQYAVSSDAKYEGFLNYSDKLFILKPGQIKQVNVHLRLECNKYGNFAIPFHVDTTTSNLQSDFTHQLTIIPKYDYSISSDQKQYLACTYDDTKIKFNIQNEVGIPNKYAITIKNVDDLKLQYQKDAILPGYGFEQPEILIKNPKKDGFTNLIVEVTDELGNVKKNLPIQVETGSCTNLHISYQEPAEVKDPLCPTTLTYLIEIDNKGKFDEKINLLTDQPEGKITFNMPEFTLQSGKKIQVKAFVETADLDAEQQFTIQVLRWGEQIQSKTFSYKTMSDYTCNKLVGTNVKQIVRIDDTKASFRFKNTGYAPNTYDLSIVGPDWVSLETDKLDLAMNNEQWINLKFDADNQLLAGKYDFKLIAQPTGKGYRYEIPLSLTVRNKTYFERAYEFIFLNNCRLSIFIGAAIIVALLLVLIIIKITAPNYQYKLSNRIEKYSKIAYTLLAIWLIAALFVVLIFGIPNLPKSYHAQTNSSALYFEWPQDAKFKITLSKYFSDPDKDTLTYSTDGTEHVKAQIKGDTATLTPQSGWYGKEIITFIATDSQGGSSPGKPMTLSVVQVIQPNICEYGSALKYYMALGLLFIILVIVFFMVIFSNRRPTKR
jgi:hypothetical protein